MTICMQNKLQNKNRKKGVARLIEEPLRGGGLYFIFITFLKNVEKYIC